VEREASNDDDEFGGSEDEIGDEESQQMSGEDLIKLCVSHLEHNCRQNLWLSGLQSPWKAEISGCIRQLAVQDRLFS
jgi:hypothetical protein